MVEQSFIVRQISIFLDNRPGSLALMARRLADAGINLRALSLAETRDFGTARIVVANPEVCKGALKGTDFHSVETEVLAIEVADRPGGMADVLEIIAQEHLDVEYIYAMAVSREGSAIVIVRVNDPPKAVAALQAKGVRLFTQGDIAAL